MADPVALGIQVPQPQNPLDIAGKFAAFQNASNQNRLFQSEFAARNALGAAIGQATSPEGNLDLDKLQAAIATPGNPAAFKGLEVANTIMQRRLTEVQIQQAKLQMAAKHDELLGGALAPLIAKGPAVTRGDVTQAAANLVARLQAEGVDGGLASFKNMAKAISTAPESGPQLVEWLTNVSTQAENSRKIIEAHLGAYHDISTGGGTSVIREPTVGAPPYQVGQTSNTQTPGELNSTVTGKDALGRDVTTSRGALGMNAPASPGTFQATGGPPAIPTAAAPGPTGSSQDMGAPAAPPAAAAPSARAVGAGSGEASAPPRVGAGLTGPDATTAKALEGQGINVKDYEKTLIERNAIGNQQMVQIKKIQSLMEKAYMGGGASVYQQIASWAQALPSSFFAGKTPEEQYKTQQSWVDAISGGNLAASQELSKLFMQNATKSLRGDLEATGGRTAVEEWNQYQKNNPQISTDPRAVEDMLNFFVRNYNLTKQELREWNKFKTQALKSRQPIDLTGFAERWQKKLEGTGILQTEEKSGYSKGLKGQGGTSRPPLESFFK